MHHQLAVYGHAQPHVVDGLAREALFGRVAKRGGVVGLAVVQLAFNVPQAIVAFKALVVHPADMFQGAGGGGTQGHGKRKIVVQKRPRLLGPACAVVRRRDTIDTARIYLNRSR